MVRKGYGSPADLARGFSLRRANARAKAFRPDSTYYQKRRLSDRIDALYVLVMKDNPSCASLHPPNVDMSVMQDGTKQEQKLWDRNFSSMSSYCSNLDELSEERITDNTEMVRAGSFCDRLCSNDASLPSKEDYSLAFDDCWMEEESLGMEATRKNSLTRRKIASISSFMPADVEGVVRNSIAIVKHSHNPYKDFRESIYQMIVENGLHECSDMEELLYCYLCLNVSEQHDLIKKAFTDVWTEILMRVSEFKVRST